MGERAKRLIRLIANTITHTITIIIMFSINLKTGTLRSSEVEFTLVPVETTEIYDRKWMLMEKWM